MSHCQLSPRAYTQRTTAHSWEEIWEAGPYYDRVSELLEDASNYAIFAGWQIDSRIRLKKPARPSLSNRSPTPSFESLREKVIRICEEKPNFEIYFLLWDHAYLYVFEREVWQGRIWENIHRRIHFVFDNKHPFGGSHHEKVAIFDGRIALTGGIDLCNERWDDPQHLFIDPRRSLDGKKENHGPYHDLAVQVTGPICQGIHLHLTNRWHEISSIPFPAPLTNYSNKNSGYQVYLSRTVVHIDQFLTREIEFLFRDLIFSANERIILEGQYYWSRTLNDILISKMQQMKGKKFEVILVLANLKNIKSLTRKMLFFEMSLIKRLEYEAHLAGTKLIVGSPYVSAPDLKRDDQIEFPSARSIYIHSKILIIDDQYLCIGSANFADRALRVDTELHLTLEAQNIFEKNHIRKVAEQVLRHWGLKSNLEAYENSDIYIRPFPPLESSSKMHWELVFDPPFPWLYPLQHKLYKELRRRTVPMLYSMMSLCFLATFIFFRITLKSDSAPCYFLILGSVWFAPIPIFLMGFLMTIPLGVPVATKLVISAIWMSSIVGYFLIRTFPTSAQKFFHHTAPYCWPLNALRKRNFSILLSLLFDPRISLHAKIASQSLAFVPFPWFALGTLILLPATFYLLVRYLSEFMTWVLPLHAMTLTEGQVSVILGLAFILSTGKVLLNLWKNAD